MNRLLAVVLVFLSMIPSALAAERILSFDSQIVVYPNASVSVTETITVVVEGEEIKRGIYRDFPTRYKTSSGLNKNVDFEVIQILRDGKPEPWHTATYVGGERIYIGRESYFLPRGTYTYTIKYQVDRVVGYFDSFDEIFWNVTGNEWAFPIEKASARVIIPKNTYVLKQSAYTGKYGDRGTEYRVEQQDNHAVYQTTSVLGPGEGLSVAVSWPKGVVREPSDIEKNWLLILDNLTLALGLLTLVLLAGFYFSAWLKVGKDPEKGPVIPLFRPPEEFSPAMTHYVMEMGHGYGRKGFAAALVNLAVKGYLRIEEKDKKYALIRESGKKKGALSPGEEILFRELLGAKRAKLELKNKNHSILQRATEKFRKKIEEECGQSYFKTNRKYVYGGIFITLIYLAVAVLLSDSPAEAMIVVAVFGAWILVISSLLARAFYSWRQTLAGNSVLRVLSAIMLFAFLFPLIGMMIAFGWMMSQMLTLSVPVIIILMAIVFLNIAFYEWMKAPTLRGRKIMDQIEGFTLFLKIAEKDRFEAMHPPEMTPALFEKYLPYAIALGVENAWGEKFEKTAREASKKPEEYQPVWYSGSGFSSGAFKAAGFTSALGPALSSSIASASAAPSSSGSSGGGFSGGGGGGGGGGGW